MVPRLIKNTQNLVTKARVKRRTSHEPNPMTV